MLFEAIKLRDEGLEEKYFSGEITGEEIYNFLDMLMLAIPKIHDGENYRDSLDLLTKWKTIYLEKTEEVYDKRLNYKYNHEKLTSQLINEQTKIYEKFDSINANKNNPNKASNTAKKPYNIFYIFSNIDPLRYENGVTESDTKPKKKVLEINENFKTSSFVKALEGINEILSFKEFNRDGLDIPTSAFIVSWALHAKANIACSTENYNSAYAYYKGSLVLKDKLMKESNEKIPNSILFYSYYHTFLKEAALSIVSPDIYPQKVIEKLLNFYSELKTVKNVIEEIDSTHYLSILNNYYYYLGKNYIYAKENELGLMYLDKSYELSKEINDVPGILRAHVHKTLKAPDTTSFSFLESTRSILDPVSDQKWLVNPTLRALTGEKHLDEYAITLNDPSLPEEFPKVFAKKNIFPLPKILPSMNYGYINV